MTPSQQAKLFSRQYGLKLVACSVSKTVTVSKRIVHDSWFIKCFDNYKQAVEFFTTAHNEYVNKGVAFPWSTYNVK